MREVVGQEWANKYRLYGIRPVYVNWAFHNQYFNAASTRFLRISYSGLPFLHAYDAKTKGKKADQVVIPNIPAEMSVATARTYLLGYGNVVFPASTFELVADLDFYDFTITYSMSDGSAFSFSTTAGQSFALPSCAYGFVIWPITQRKKLLEMHGYPLPESKRSKLGHEKEKESDDEDVFLS